MNLPNYDKEMEKAMAQLPAGSPLLLHACCAPCASAVVERLSSHFAITLWFDNPNIQPYDEYCRRRDEARRLVQFAQTQYPLQLAEGAWDEAAFLAAAEGLETEPEGGLRCNACFALRLGRAAREAQARGIGWYTTTLSISPHKNAHLLNTIGAEQAAATGVRHLPADFKKRDGYKRSIELSRDYGLYRQTYCGCLYSWKEAQRPLS